MMNEEVATHSTHNRKSKKSQGHKNIETNIEETWEQRTTEQRIHSRWDTVTMWLGNTTYGGNPDTQAVTKQTMRTIKKSRSLPDY